MDGPHQQPPDDWEASEVRQLYNRFIWNLQRHRKRVWIAASILFVLGWVTFLFADQRSGAGVLLLAALVLAIGLPVTAPNADLNTQAGVQDGLTHTPHGPAL
jgi:hypothetical protein